MKKIILSSLMAMALMPCAYAQTEQTTTQTVSLEQLLVYENPKIYVIVGGIDYKPQSAAQQVKSAVVSAVTSKELSVEDESMVSMAKNSLQTAVQKTLRFTLLQGEPSEQQKSMTLKFTATITGCNTTSSMRGNYPDKKILITAYVYLTNIVTGEVVASRQVTGESWAGLFTNLAEAESDAAHNLMVDAINQFNAWYPLRGHMLDKGFEKGKKQKLKEIYIDLGSGNNLGTGYTCDVFTVKRIAGRVARRFIGRGKIAEVLGGDISSVKLTKGADLIKEAFDNGAEIAVAVQ